MKRVVKGKVVKFGNSYHIIIRKNDFPLGTEVLVTPCQDEIKVIETKKPVSLFNKEKREGLRDLLCLKYSPAY